jgi:hypothetical protein
LYRSPVALILGSLIFPWLHTIHTITCWSRAGKFEPLLLTPLLLIGRMYYAAGMAEGGTRYLVSESGRRSENKTRTAGPHPS